MKTHRAWRKRAQKAGANWQRARVAVERVLRDNATAYQATVLASKIVKAHRDAGGVRTVKEIVAQELAVLDVPLGDLEWLEANVVQAFEKGLRG